MNSRPSPASLERARALHQRALVFDAHVDTLSEMVDRSYDLDSAPDDAHLSWPRFQEGGLKAQLFACFVDPALPPERYPERVDRLIDRFQEEVARIPDRLASCTTGSQVEEAVRGGRFAGMLSIEGGHAIGDSLDTLRRFHARGVRAMTLTWNNSNSWADGCGPMDPALPRHGGLTEFGRKVVAAMEEMGMAVDISHVSPDTWRDVMACATRPPFASHSSLRSLNDHRRNLTDDQLRELADAGGVLGVCFCSGFLVDESAAWARAKQTPEYAAIPPDRRTDFVDFAGITPEEYAVYDRHVPRARLEDAVAHVDRALRLMGVEHVALGSDFDGARRFPEGLEHAGKLPALTAGLLDRGWSEDELEGLLGRNLLRYFREITG